MQLASTAHRDCLPTILPLHLTNRCNLGCKYCYESEIGNRGLETIDPKAVRRAVEVINPTHLFFFGGEPLLEPRLLKDLIREYRHLKLWVGTNGILLSQSWIEFFLEYGVIVKLSYDTLDPEVNRLGRNIPEDRLNYLRKTIERFPKLFRVVVTMSPENGTVSELLHWCKIVGVRTELNFRFTDKDFDVLGSPLYQDIKQNPHILDHLKEGYGKDKLRLHVDGTVSRSLIQGWRVLGHVDSIGSEILEIGTRTDNVACSDCSARHFCDLDAAFSNERDWYGYESDGLGTMSYCVLQREVQELRQRSRGMSTEQPPTKSAIYVEAENFESILDNPLFGEPELSVFIEGIPDALKVDGDLSVFKEVLAKSNDTKITVLVGYDPFCITIDEVTIRNIWACQKFLRVLVGIDMSEAGDLNKAANITSLCGEVPNIVVVSDIPSHGIENGILSYLLFSDKQLACYANFVFNTGETVDSKKLINYMAITEGLKRGSKGDNIELLVDRYKKVFNHVTGLSDNNCVYGVSKRGFEYINNRIVDDLIVE